MSELKLEEMLQQAFQFHSAGQLNKAERLYRNILTSSPKHPDALHYLGTIALQVGQTTAAIDLIEKAIRVKPDYADAIGNLGNAQQALGRLEEAKGNYIKALTINPNMAMVRANLANVRCQLNQFEEAIDDYKAVLLLQPELHQVHRNLASALLTLGRTNEAFQSISQAVQLKPDSIEVLLTYGNVLQKLLRLEEAAECYQKILLQQPKVAEVHCNLANVLRESGQLEEAETHYQLALEIKPDYAEGLCNFALLSKDAGKLNLATNQLRSAIKLEPNYAKAHHMLANLVKHSEMDAEMKQMQAILTDSTTNDEQKMYLGFGLGKSYADLKQYDQSFEYYQIANTLRRKSFNYTIDDDIEFFSRLKSTFSKKLFAEQKTGGLSDPSPIFIIGMPRSGTTLVEQILASHAEVYGAGELRHMPSSIAAIFGVQNDAGFYSQILNATADMFRQSAELYLNQIRSLTSTARFITDKLPMNFLNVGMIKLLFPRARIIHCQRNPLDTCLSIYKNLFIQLGHSYAYEQTELATFYNLYLELMEHWEQVLPGHIYTINYEKLVKNQESESRKLLTACDLDWDPACLEFHKTQRQVSTISASQVRRPMYNSSIEKWKHYQTHLSPLIKILNKESRA